MTASVDTDDILIGRNWSRWLPDTGVVLVLQWATILGPLAVTRDLLSELPLFDGMLLDDRGWASSAWDRLQPYAEQDMASFRAEIDGRMGPSPESRNDQHTGPELRGRIDEAAARVGMGPLTTVDDVFTYMLACQLISAQSEVSPPTYTLSSAPPLPSQVLRLPVEDAFREATWYGWYRNGDASERIMSLVGPGEVRLATSLEKLSKRTLLGSEAVREAVLWLVARGILHANADIAALDRYKVFELEPVPQPASVPDPALPA
ncbi:DUF6042 family protein [Nonomuraea sp. NPDC049400]|uniref:DUF6042 family protein n=1 Tax=Nonomuraea sp. NPDC049400 TaxID=3364352 RepID=UPI0037AA36DB